MSPPGPPKGEGGRSKIEVPMEIVETACRFNPTAEQVLESLRYHGYPCSVDTLYRVIREQHGVTFAEFRDQKTEHTKLKLVQKAITMALDGNPTMLIFCLKNLCDWRDKPKEDLDDQFRRMSVKELIVLVKEKLPELEAKP